jgi:nitric oxide reductase NorQ protein
MNATPPAGTVTSEPPTVESPTVESHQSSVPAPVVPSGKLRMGELRRLVAAHLAAHPGVAHTPGAIAKALNRSSGAVGNALSALAARGEAEIASEGPMRYRATDRTQAATAAPIARPTASPSRPQPRTVASSSSGSHSATAPASDATAGPPLGSVEGPGRPARVPKEEPVTGPVRRPNGLAYHPRTLADLPDVAALRKLRAAGIPVLLYGPPGTGKTSLIEAAYPDLITLAGDGDTAVADFIGDYTQNPSGGYEFVHGPLVTAMREGRTLFIDDATLISPKVLAVVYPAMDGRREIQVKAHRGESVTAADGFYVVAGHNPGVHGAVLTEALASRFAAQIQVSTDYDLAAALKIESRAVRVAKDLAIRQARGEIGWAPQLRELLAFRRLATTLGTEAAVGNLIGIAPEEDRDAVATAVTRVYGRNYTPLALGRQI